MIKKNYKTSTLTRVFTLGLKRYGVKIASGDLIKVGLFPKRMLIDDIDKISFEVIKVQNTSTYAYVITNKRGKTMTLSYSLLEGITFQELFRDLIKLNPNITLCDKVKWFLVEDIVEKKLKFDFQVHKGEFSMRNRELTQKYPSLNAFIGFTIVFILLASIALFGGIGDYLLTQRFGDNYPTYRMVAFVISGIAFAAAMTNLFISLVSMYLGHKVTIISLIITVIGFCVGIL